jgi:PAS domain S-box-containing protein
MNHAYTKGTASTIDNEVLWDKGGSSFDVEYTSVPIRQDDAIIGAVVVFRDITDRKEAQAQLQKLSSAVEQSPTTVVITDVEGRIEYVNPKFTEVTGYTREEAIGQNPRILKSDEQPPEFYEDLWKTIISGQDWRGEFCNRKKTGETYWESASISPIRDADGNPTHFVAVKEDVTDRKRAEQALLEARHAAEAATKAKSDFLANMSHEIRTPMNGIIGMTDLTLDTDLTPEQRDYLNTVKTSADALLTLINDILDFSKIEAGKLELEPIDFALRDALADMLNTLANRAHSKGLELIYDVPSEVHDALIGDVYRVRQVIVNLVGNAIKFTERGEIVVSVAQVERTDADTTLHFTVRDTGIGIPPDKLEAIFRPFEQADASTTRQFGGTGLGLAISVQLVELMGGRIWAESEVGKGSMFHFTAVFGLGKPAPAADARERRGLLEGLPVLVVDDNATNRRILEQMLRNWRMKPQDAADGASALAALDRAANAGQPFRLVLSDVNMPEMDGFTLFERTRSNPQHQDVPFVLLTSAARPGDVARCREIGVAAHLIKPVKQSLLMNAIASAVAGRDAVDLKQEEPLPTANTTTTERALYILLAEDNATNQKFAVRAIEKAGHKAVVANNGLEAVQAWEKDAYDVVLMDVQMPELDGLEATARIRGLEQERGVTSRTPIIAMTANAMKGDRERCLEAGMDGYISKPVKRQTLFAEIERVLGIR